VCRAALDDGFLIIRDCDRNPPTGPVPDAPGHDDWY
jgi:hypothetical protein